MMMMMMMMIKEIGELNDKMDRQIDVSVNRQMERQKDGIVKMMK